MIWIQLNHTKIHVLQNPIFFAKKSKKSNYFTTINVMSPLVVARPKEQRRDISDADDFSPAHDLAIYI